MSNLPSAFVRAELGVQSSHYTVLLVDFVISVLQIHKINFNSDGVQGRVPFVAFCISQDLTQRGSLYLPYDHTMKIAFSCTFHVNFMFSPVNWKQFVGSCPQSINLRCQLTSEKNECLCLVGRQIYFKYKLRDYCMEASKRHVREYLEA